MRGKASPTTRVFESPYATTILPAKAAGRPSKGAAVPAAAVAPPAPVAEVAVYAPPTQAPVYEAALPLFAAPATDYPVHYPSPPGFPPQPHYAHAAQVADPALPAPTPPAPVGYPSASYQPVYQAAPYQPAMYPPPTTPPSSYQPNRFEPQGYQAPGYQPQPFQNYPPPPGRSTGSKVAIGVAIGVVGLIGILILAAIAIPVFLNQRAKTANRNFVLPPFMLEQPQLHSTTLDTAMGSAVDNLRDNMKGLTETQGAYYGPDDQPLFAIVGGRLPYKPTAADENSFFAGVATDDRLTSFVPTGSGPHGGKMECGQAVAEGEAPITFCASVDSAAVVIIIGFNQTTDQTAILSREVIDSVEPARP